VVEGAGQIDPVFHNKNFWEERMTPPFLKMFLQSKGVAGIINS
jgi:hypothetical protein